MDRDAIGYALTLSGTFLAALGYVLQKAAHNSHESAHGRAGPLSHSPTWLAGLVCMVASAGLVVAASPFLDQSKSAPLGAATLVFNMVLATLLLKERFTVVAAVSTAVIVGGVVIAVSSSEAASTNFTFGDILRLARDPLVAVYACAAAAGMGGAAWWLVRLDARPERVWSAREKAAFVLAAPLLGGWCNGFVS